MKIVHHILEIVSMKLFLTSSHDSCRPEGETLAEVLFRSFIVVGL
jgi:hypothetical protein